MLTLFHTNDFHNRLTMAQAQRLRHRRESAGEDTLLLDAGDAVGSGNITFLPGGEPILDLMSEAGYDAMTVGNREFHFSRIGFQTKLHRARFPVLCANVRPARSEPFQVQYAVLKKRNGLEALPEEGIVPAVPVLYREMSDGMRVLVLGLTVPMITVRMLSRKVSAYVFDDPLETAVRLVPQLRSQYSPDLFVALTHIGLGRDRLLAERVPTIDLILGGHSHDTLEKGERVGDTLIAQTGSWAKHVGVVEVSRRASGRLTMEARLETL